VPFNTNQTGREGARRTRAPLAIGRPTAGRRQPLPPAVVAMVGGLVATTTTLLLLLLCDLLTFLVPSLLIFAAFARLNLLSTKVNKISKNSKDYIII